MDIDRNIASLLLRRLQNIASDEENQAIETWAASSLENRQVLDRLEDEETLRQDLRALFALADSEAGRARLARMEDKIMRAAVAQRPSKRHRIRIIYAAAAVLLLLTVFWFSSERADRQAAGEIRPGGNRATLSLADGRVIDLDETQSGIIVAEDIMYGDGSKLLKTGDANVNIGRYAMLSTPKGGAYQVVLPDGTQVWLNAASSIRYPTSFAESRAREVEIVGEAYLVVAADSVKPFRVASGGQIIEVLGTEFNISAYPEQEEAKTTLVGGTVKLLPKGAGWDPFILEPGQQGVVGASTVRVQDVDVSQYTAWKDGFFYFRGDSPKEAFAELSRWYDIEVVYPNGIPAMRFYGKLERNKPLGTLLRILEEAGMQFTIQPTDKGVQLLVEGG